MQCLMTLPRRPGRCDAASSRVFIENVRRPTEGTAHAFLVPKRSAPAKPARPRDQIRRITPKEARVCSQGTVFGRLYASRADSFDVPQKIVSREPLRGTQSLSIVDLQSTRRSPLCREILRESARRATRRPERAISTPHPFALWSNPGIEFPSAIADRTRFFS